MKRIAAPPACLLLAASRHAIAMVVGFVVLMAGPSNLLADPKSAARETLLGGGSCALQDGEAGIVAAIIDGDTLRLDTGLEVRLVGIQAPKLPLDRLDFVAWPLSGAAKGRLEQLALGQAAILRYGGARRDRYGRALAQIEVQPEAGEAIWLQQAMVAEGLARVYSFADNRQCLGELIEAERGARGKGLGVWDDPYYAIRDAAGTELETRRDVYDLVEGRVVSVGERGPVIYLDFGRDWDTDFTVVVTREAETELAALGWPAAKLQGMRVRVRGWIEQHDGPSLRITHPEQLELLDVGE